MITPSHVQASVVDIGNRASTLPASLVVDANILYWIFYPNFGTLTATGARGPAHYQINDYPAYWARAAASGCKFFTANATLGEFAKVSEYAEMEARWRLEPPSSRPHPDPVNPSTRFDPRVCKCARYYFASDIPGVRSDINLTITSLLRSVTLLNLPATASAQRASECSAWLGSLGDFPDAALISSALAQGITNFLSDDADLTTFPGITLNTANRNAINAARRAGKLV